jgi:heat shock protein HtpX
MNTVSGTRLNTQLRTFLLLAGLTGLLVVIGGLLFKGPGLILFALFAIVMNFAAYWWSDKMALKMSRAEPLDEADDPRLFAIVRDLAQRAELPMPRLYLIPQEQPNAFATGRNEHHAAVAVTAGLRRHMPEDQLAGVLAHELAHIKNRDILIQSVGAMIAGVISGIANWLQFSFLFGGGDDNDSPLGFVGVIATMILAPLAATLLQLAVSRQREFLADATGARFLGRPEPLADALETLSRGTEVFPMKVNPAAEALFIVNPLRGSSMAGLFATHPPLEERVRRLRALVV